MKEFAKFALMSLWTVIGIIPSVYVLTAPKAGDMITILALCCLGMTAVMLSEINKA